MKKIVILIAMFSLAGCGIYGKYKPQTEVREDLYGEGVVTDTLSFGNLEWRTVFTDPCLQTLIDSALVRNSDMRTALLKVDEAEASLMTARLAYIPSFTFAPQGTLSGLETGNPTASYSIPVNASWQIDIFGKLTNTKRMAKAAYQQSVEYSHAVRSELIASVANLYYTLLMLDEQLAITLKTQEIWKESVDATSAMKDAGMVTDAALAQTEASYYSICNSVLDLKEQINTTSNSLSLLIADAPQEIQRGNIYDQTFPEEMAVGIPLTMLSNRPDVRSAEFNLARAFYNTAYARSSFYPSIVLTGNGGWTNLLGNVIVNPAQAIVSLIGSLTQPIFQNGKIVAQYRIAKAQQEEAKIAFEQTLLNAGTEVNNALMQYQTAKAKTDYYIKQVESLESAVESTELLMQNSSTTYLEVLTARQSLLSAELSAVANRLYEIQGMITLYKALGGGRE